MVTKGIPWDDLPAEKARGVAVARTAIAASSTAVTSASGSTVDTVASQDDSSMPISSERNLIDDGETHFRILTSPLM